MKKIFFSVIIITCVFRAQALASSAAGIVEKGNRLYQDQKYADAAKHYDQALSKQPDSAIINFDAGAAQYKTKEYQKAGSYFEKSLLTDDKGLEAKANYNLGNSKYMLGLSKEDTELSAAVQLLEGALKNYKRTQEITPKDEDVKVNYRIVEEKLKELKEKLKQQPQENKNNQKRPPNQPDDSGRASAQQQQKEDKQNQGEGQKEQAKQEEQKAEEQQGQTGQEQNEQAQQQAQQKQPSSAQPPTQSEESGRASAQPPNQPDDSGRASAQPEGAKEMSKEEANMLLEGYRQEENANAMLKDDRKGTQEKVLRDW